MAKGGKIALGVIIAVIILGGVWWWLAGQNPSSSPAPAAVNNNPPAQTAQNQTGNGQQGTTGVAASDNSDAAINQDVASMNTQLNGLSSDSASIDQGLNDQPVAQDQL